MLTALNPRAGDTYTMHGVSWVWIPAEVERGHWRALDHTGISIFPASDGIEDTMVTVPTGRDGKEMVMRFGAADLDTAFHYAANARIARGH